MKSSIEDRKFLNPALNFAFASSGDRAHRPSDGSMHIRTYSTGPSGSEFGGKTPPFAPASAFMLTSSARYAERKFSSVPMHSSTWTLGGLGVILTSKRLEDSWQG